MLFNKTIGPEDRAEDLATGLRFRESPLDAKQKARIRRLRRRDKSASEIAGIVGCDERYVVEAIGSMRGKRVNSNHRTLSVNAFAGDWMLRHQKKHGNGKKAEPMWLTMNRIIDEYEDMRNKLSREADGKQP